MKTTAYFLGLFGLFLFSGLSAQDLIQLNTGETITAKVIEIGDQISYKKASNPDGPLYLLDRYEVQQITYPNGEVDYFNVDPRFQYDEQEPDHLYDHYLSTNFIEHFEGYRLISKEEFLAKLQTNPVAYDYYSRGKKELLVGGILSGLGLVVMTAAILPRQSTSNNSISNINTLGFNRPVTTVETGPRGGVWIGSGIMVGGIVTMAIGASHCNSALNTYNIEQGQSYGIVPIINTDGIGMALRF